jgi:ubiquinone/menaquinone biosynthesis C-methylase UbiE
VSGNDRHLRSSPARPAALPLRLVHALSELPGAYQFQQRIAYPTTSRFRRFIARHVRIAAGECVLDLGCGTGSYREALGGDYTGVDVNEAYVDAARTLHTGTFAVMDCSRLMFGDASFDHVVTIAASHHLDDVQLEATLRGALRVCRPGGAVHIIDAVLPETGSVLFKRAWFRMDAGRFPRTRRALREAVEGHGRVVEEDFLSGPLHDCLYLRATPPASIR